MIVSTYYLFALIVGSTADGRSITYSPPVSVAPTHYTSLSTCNNAGVVLRNLALANGEVVIVWKCAVAETNVSPQ